MKKVAIIGSRLYTNREKIEKYMQGLVDFGKQKDVEIVFVSGGATSGADLLAKEIAIAHGWPYHEFAPSHHQHNKYCIPPAEEYGKPYDVKNFFIRNQEIAEYSDIALAFVVRGKPYRGTKDCTNQFEKLGKRVFYFYNL